LEEATPAQTETAAGWGVAGKLSKERTAAAPLNDGVVAILEKVLDPSVAVWERSKKGGETFENRLSSLEWLAARNLEVRRILVVECSGCCGVTFVRRLPTLSQLV
jgi:hypothetical protein